MTASGVMSKRAKRGKESAEAVFARLEGRLFATIPEAATVLGYDARTVRTAVENGEIPSVKVGATWRIPVSWLREQALGG